MPDKISEAWSLFSPVQEDDLNLFANSMKGGNVHYEPLEIAHQGGNGMKYAFFCNATTDKKQYPVMVNIYCGANGHVNELKIIRLEY
ncbi:hypothetical protein [Celerinatantimonas diazotrophica]|uniref:Uncharacterized protein n=1 Tax=Celerinatantimonas diazotrophica TaxID=412034 RepID=A0A4R1JA24_9GAMM|nr:hypothetical protein [Celerinatantimonas diazotrophica]TCK47485.1 hypothetical protein EV690_2512 [Celerinatantimonas diazotrophica]CAG9296897.1 hypothetical protein CEDIAZO_02059 [Celerinatantimonas diazotrophica]